MKIRIANAEDLAILLQYDRHVSRETLKKKLADGRILIAQEKGTLVGWLRYGLFWDEIPFMNLLYVLEEHQNQGFGTALVRAWERQMLDAGYDKVMTSTLEQETAQHFYRKLGYRDLGKFMPFADEYEIVMGKMLP